MSDARAELLDWVRVTGFTSERGYRWRWGDVAHDPIALVWKRHGDYPTVVTDLAQGLYERLYTRSDPKAKAAPDRLLHQGFISALDWANASLGPWEPGWRVVERLEAKVRVVDAKGSTRTVPLDAWRETAGGHGEVRLLKGSAKIQPGWYHVRSDALFEPAGAALSRVYWNVTRNGALPLVNAVSGTLNAEALPFRFKIADDPQRFTRADGAVLYFARDLWPRFRAPLARVHAQVAHHLRAPTPVFTKRLGHGMGGADDPRPKTPDAPLESFGMSRCRLVAEGLWDAHAAGQESAQARIDAIDRSFRQEGLSLDAPHLGPGVRDDPYRLDLAPFVLPAIPGVV